MNEQLVLIPCQHYFPIPEDPVGAEDVEVKCKWCSETKQLKTLRGLELGFERKHRWRGKVMYAGRTIDELGRLTSRR
uniref:Uncharacterized protein n=1 Tax=viral metagenome TaxID=1070528 RepID=A0A6M3LF15_9ZZZZ